MVSTAKIRISPIHPLTIQEKRLTIHALLVVLRDFMPLSYEIPCRRKRKLDVVDFVFVSLELMFTTFEHIFISCEHKIHQLSPTSLFLL